MKNLFQLSYMRGFTFLVLICALFLQISCSGVISSLDDYSGKTLYEASVESKQEVLDFVPDIQAEVYQHLETEKEKQIFKDFQEDFLKELVEENPDFAKEFYDKMHSDDREEVNQALTEAGKLVEEELRELTGDSEINAKNVVDAVLQKYKKQQN